MLRWKKEECHLLDDFSKLAALRTSLVIPEDVEMGKRASTWWQLYSNSISIPTLLKELKNLPTPTNEKDGRYLQNLVWLDSIIKVLTEENEQGKLDCILVERITKAAFPENNHREYNVSFLAASKSFTKLGVEARLFTEEDGMKSFESQENQVQRLALLQTYIDEQLQLIHKLAAGTPDKQIRKPKHIQNPHGNNLIDPREA